MEIATILRRIWVSLQTYHVWIMAARASIARLSPHKASSLWSKLLKLDLNLSLSVCFLLPILTFSFHWPVLDMAFSLKLRLEGQHSRVSSLQWCDHCTAMQWCDHLHSFLPGLVKASLYCCVKDAVLTFVRYFQFLGNVLQLNRLVSFWRKLW